MSHPAIDPEEPYNESSDEDFDPTTAVEQASSASSEDEELQPPKSRSKKRKRKHNSAAEALELDSGDEATIQERKRRKQHADKGAEDEDGVYFSDDEDTGGAGGLIKTRAQRRAEGRERRPLARIDGATADVDAIWAQLMGAPLGRPPDEEKSLQPGAVKEDNDEEYITIHRTTRFAGATETETRRVKKDSQEAKLYLEEQAAAQKRKKRCDAAGTAPPDADAAGEIDGLDKENAIPDEDAAPKLRRPLKRLSRFEPNPSGEVRALPAELQLHWKRGLLRPPSAVGASGLLSATTTTVPTTKSIRATKLTTVDKSRQDWAGYVDKEGLAEELDEHGKSKGSYMDQQGFLNRVEGRRYEAEKDAREKVRAAEARAANVRS